jgi:hypothetical protein
LANKVSPSAAEKGKSFLESSTATFLAGKQVEMRNDSVKMKRMKRTELTFPE